MDIIFVRIKKSYSFIQITLYSFFCHFCVWLNRKLSLISIISNANVLKSLKKTFTFLRMSFFCRNLISSFCHLFLMLPLVVIIAPSFRLIQKIEELSQVITNADTNKWLVKNFCKYFNHFSSKHCKWINEHTWMTELSDAYPVSFLSFYLCFPIFLCKK